MHAPLCGIFLPNLFA
ncbi:MAG: hypothetical protein ACLRZ5_03830 [Ruminococcus sp.]